MFKQTKTLLLAVILILPVYATDIPNTQHKDSSTKALDPAHINALERFLKSMNVEENYGKIIDSSTDMLLRTNPSLSHAKKDIRAFYAKYLGWETIKPGLMQIYAKYYTISELEDITNFYQTDTGQKTLKLLPTTYKEGQELGMRLVNEHIDELKEIVKKSIVVPEKETKQ
jgi:hypothetical protein